jgi:carboxylesterase type B
VPFTPEPGVIYDGTGTAPPCNQPATVNGGDENCLIVNVFSPRVSLKKKCSGIVTDFCVQLPGNASDPNTTYDDLLPVIYWIHGGGFSLGSVLTYSAEKYMDKDVVLVEVQYRLGPLGWLSLNTDEVPGNAGLFDQIEGLRWTQKFVKYFGGNPNSVTIAGESAGSASVSTLLLAPQARGRFTFQSFILISLQQYCLNYRTFPSSHWRKWMYFSSLGVGS